MATSSTSISAESPYDFEKMMKDPRFGQFVGYITQQAKANNWKLQTPEQRASEMWNSPENLSKSVGERTDLINKYYAEQAAQAEKEGAANANFGMKDYQNTIDTLNQGLQSDVKDLSNSSASKGSFGSSAYNERLNSLNNQYQNKYTSAYDTAVKNADVASIKNQGLLGSSTPTQTLNQYGTQGSTGQSYKYNPFQQRSGSLEANRAYSLTNI